jgi:hypothetical protein
MLASVRSICESATKTTPQRERQEVEEECPLGLRGQRDHLAFGLGVGLVVDVLQIGSLPAEAGPVVDDLAVDLAGRVVDETHSAAGLVVEKVVDVVIGDFGQNSRA